MDGPILAGDAFKSYLVLFVAQHWDAFLALVQILEQRVVIWMLYGTI